MDRLCPCGAHLVKAHARGRWPTRCAACLSGRKRRSGYGDAQCRCGGVFKRSAPEQKHCSHQCAQISRPNRGGVKHRDQLCAHCATSFRKLFASKFCSLSCSGKAQAKQPAQIVCQQCGAVAARKTASGTDRTKFCSRECAFVAKAAAKRPKRAWVSPQRECECRACGASFWRQGKSGSRSYCSVVCRDAAHAHNVKRYTLANYVPVARVPRECAECGQAFLGHARTLHCSESCARRRQRRIAKRVLKARKRGVQAERVDPRVVFTRDGWTCQMCHKRTPSRLRGHVHPDAPELDHIVPLSKGGAHTYQNTQCACRACNGAKGNKIQGQLRLVG